MIRHFLQTTCMWVVSDDQKISYSSYFENSFENTLKVSTLIAYDRVRGVEMSHKACNELYLHLSIITFLFI